MPSLRSRFPVELGCVPDPESQVGRLHRLAVAGGPTWGLTQLLRRVVQVDSENSAGQTALFLSALLGHSSAVQLLLASGANPNQNYSHLPGASMLTAILSPSQGLHCVPNRCLDGSTPMHAGAFSGRSLVLLHLLQAGGDLRLHDRQGRSPRDWAEQGGAKQSWEMLELLQLCRAHMSALVHGSELAPAASLGQWQASSGHSLCGGLRLVQADRAWRPERTRRPSHVPALGFGQLSSLWPLGLVTGVPLADPKELLPAQGEPDRTYRSSSHTLMANLLWRGHPVTVRQLKVPGAQADVLLADLQHCSALHHPSLLLLMALCPSEDLSGLCLLFEPVCLGSLHVVLHPRGPREGGPPHLVPGLLPGHLLLQVLEALLFLQARWRAHGGLSSHAVQLVRPGLAKVGGLEHGRPLHQRWLQPRPRQGYPWGGPGRGLPPPPELYPWLPLELIRGDTPAATSDLYSFCILAQEVFTGELPWAGRKGPEVKAKLEAGESPALDPLVPAPYQALVRAGLGLGPADRRGSLQSTRYLLREAMAQDSASEVMGHSRVQRGATWDSGSSLTLGSSPSPRPGLCPGHSPTARVSLDRSLEPRSTGPALHASLQDSASLLGTQSSEERFERKFSAKIQALRGLRQHTHRAALLDPQPREPSPCLLTHREASHALEAAGREGHEGRYPALS
ncbi:inactive serine/threonine-protein kinase TEX14-like isoform X1 [Cervus elaphus]|uniref:inactive serine/threonine-protein kinase TEX14-like isoform X1 n=1 Tax=Cervus elaphus TaxID=9860 RepID=UPI001CC2AB85|nr:inactive serine/threonine-protein kinase TEX14-like isoform X1 [Cervus elaphus]XP_043748315.1 inactive serine/threonine-protein kinase TEX14-like isoform X1 [Cervus elaphus]XP_043748324.1 inactive serine/threonine-protein kinase TEX14-like isoform X1 [Cervus elaphus]XP_043748330.1 inactive serine/threonine-protein kinase TEX14-like isoform X1 [Cervus elaphus]XP_043748339.1 inactive serine/threonine-protein kinase TEX14-like isoform X1 [Cervus elaphus]